MSEVVILKAEAIFAKPIPRWKRAMDVTGSFFGLILLAPVFLLIALYIKIVSPGPVFFRQSRVGYCGNDFIMYKFRTMRADADTSRHREHMARLIHAQTTSGCEKDSGAMRKLDDEPQLIPLAPILRKTCVDELPQLLNVLRGEMTLVGPRPSLRYEVDQFLRWHAGRFDALPGMTGLWQVSGKNELSFEEMVRLDIRYTQEMSIRGDLKILLKTPGVIFTQVRLSLARRYRDEYRKTT